MLVLLADLHPMQQPTEIQGAAHKQYVGTKRLKCDYEIGLFQLAISLEVSPAEGRHHDPHPY
nr:hypothetical protein Iba_chr10eCG7480 [Ipomoea batatas]